MLNTIKKVLFVTVLAVGIAFWAPSAYEKALSVQATPPGATSFTPLDICFQQGQSIAAVWMRLKRIDVKLGVNIVRLPSPDAALSFDDLPADAKPHYIAAARFTLIWFGVIEFAIVAWMLAAGIVALTTSTSRGFSWLFGAYSLGVLLGAVILTGHILVGLRPNLAAQMGFWTFNLAGEVICAAVVALSECQANARKLAAQGVLPQPPSSLFRLRRAA